MMLSVRIILSFIIYFFPVSSSLLTKNATCSMRAKYVDGEIIDRLLKNHDKRDRPNLHGDPTVVTVNIQFVKISDINPNGYYGAEFYFRMQWLDPRMCHNSTHAITLQGKGGDDFWNPDVYFANSLKSTTHTVTDKNSNLDIHPSGLVYRSLRVTVQADCPQDLTRFPFDVQVCKLEVASYSYGVDRMILKWQEKNPVKLNNKETNQFEIKEVSYEEGKEIYPTGAFGFLTVKFRLQRRIGYYIFQLFIPCIIVVCLSFVPFWIDPENIGDRLAVGISAVLTVVFLMGSINADLPRVSYFKVIDGYLIGCFLMVFAGIIETVVAFSGTRDFAKDQYERDTKSTSNRRKPSEQSRDASIIVNNNGTARHIDEDHFPDCVPAEVSGTSKSNQVPFTKRKNVKITIDKVCRIAFPLVFIVSNATYWMINSKDRK